MAITNNGTRITIGSEQLPSGTVYPTVTTFTDWEYVIEKEYSVLKSTVENATAITTVAQIISNGTIGVTKQSTDLIAADYISSNTVTYWTDIISISDNFANRESSSSVYFKATAFSYLVKVKIYIKTA